MNNENDQAAPGALPAHVAFIMDGNGRWAEAKGLPRALGHRAGAETVRRVAAFALRRGIPYLTLYAFSTENWSRPPDEVDALMRLLAEFVDGELPSLMEKDIRLKIIGDRGRLPETLAEKLDTAEVRTAGNASLVLVIAINYGGRDEIVRAVRSCMRDARDNGADPAALGEADFSKRLDTAGLPDPDLVVRTAGEMRLSNFLIWQAAYAEFLFSERAWPDFSDADFEDALVQFGKRKRKFGGAEPAKYP